MTDGIFEWLDRACEERELTPAAALKLRNELRRRFYQALGQLEEDDYQIIQMRQVQQLSNTEAAQALHLSPPAAEMRHLRALRRLRELLGEATSLPR